MRRRNPKQNKNGSVKFGSSSSASKPNYRRRKMNSNGIRTIETSISVDNIKDQVIAFLYAIGVVHDNEGVVDITMGEVNNNLVPLAIQIKREGEVKLIRHG
jgi:hypothetical protein